MRSIVPAPILLPAKIDALVDALSRNRYLLVFDEIASWFDEQFQVKNPDVRRVLHGLVSSAHMSVLLITERKPFFDPQNSPIPPGVLQNEELFGLQEADGIILLKEYLPGGDEALLRKIVESCGANPLMLCWFGYLIASGRQDATTVLDSEGIELFRKLLSGTVEDLTEESREALSNASIFRVPLPRKDLERLQVPFQAAVVPLVDRFNVLAKMILVCVM